MDITSEKLKELNNDYFNVKAYTSTSPNMKAVAYMLDTAIWTPFATSNQNYAEYAIGGPTIELLFKAYNKYKGLTENTKYVAEAKSEEGYQISKDGGTNFADYYNGIIESNSPYLIDTTSSYWLASPSKPGYGGRVMCVSSGKVGDLHVTLSSSFRPIVLLDSNFTLEKTKDSNGNDAFKIVEQ